MPDPTKPARKSSEARPGAGEMFLRHVFGWLYIKALAWIRRAPVATEWARARPLARLFSAPEDILTRRNVPLVFDEPTARRVNEQRLDYHVRLTTDIARMLRAGPAGILSRAKVTGVEHLEAAISEKKGVLLVSAHAGTWWHAPAVVASLGHPVSSVLTRFLPGSIVRYLEEVARELHCSLTFVRMGAYEAARAAFRKGEVFFLSFDFASRSDRSMTMPIGERAEFLVDTGPGVMAVRHQIPVVWVDTFHDDAGRSCIRFLPAIHAGRGTDYPKTESVLHYFMDRLNDQVASHPEQWWLLGHGFMHQRPAPVLPTSDIP